MMASALDSVGDKKRVRTKLQANYKFLLVFADNFTTKSCLASLVYIRLELQLIIDSIRELIFIHVAHAILTLCVNLAVNPERDSKQKKSNVLPMSTTHIFISLQILLLSKETALSKMPKWYSV